jgi:hypothetical protein
LTVEHELATGPTRARGGLVAGCLRRVYAQYRRQPDDLAKNVFLANMRDHNEVLFYRLLA